jgi:hypothetical protein
VAGLTVSVEVVSPRWTTTIEVPTEKRLLKPALEEVRRKLLRKKVVCQVLDDRVRITVD